MSNKLLITMVAVFALGAAGCATTNETANVNVNADGTKTMTNAPDDSVVTTTTDAKGVKTETRVFRNNRRVSKVVVTTRDGRRTTRVYSPKGEEKDINDVGDALSATGDKIAEAAGWVADKTVDAAKATGEGAKVVGEKTVGAAKTVGKKTAEGAKKTGSAIKKAVTP